jgi:hypothetical protein
MISFTEGWIFLFSLFVCWTADNDGIGDEGVIGIAEGLEKNTSLSVLHLKSMFRPFHSTTEACIFSYSLLF